MFYTFVADRKLVFVVDAGGRKRLVEFGERDSNNASLFSTTDADVAKAIRRSSMSRRGIIIETTVAQKPEEPRKKAAVAPKPTAQTDAAKTDVTQGDIREYDNFTQAREAISKEFGIAKSTVRNPTALERAAKEHGFSIKYKNAEK